LLLIYLMMTSHFHFGTGYWNVRILLLKNYIWTLISLFVFYVVLIF